MEEFKLVDNKDSKQYQFSISGHLAKIEYIRAGDKIYLTHTEVPKELSGQGIGGQLVRSALEDIRKQGLSLIPLCPFVAGYIKDKPEWHKLLMKGINIG